MDISVLNREQRKAAETLEGPLLILAGAGSGKTRALTYRLANLIDHGVPAWNILALTFTNKAAREMKNRVEALIGSQDADEAWIGTFHSICARILRRDIEKLGYSRSFVIYDEDDQIRVLKEIYKQLNVDDSFIPLRETGHKISDAKNRMLSPDEWFAQSGRDYRSNQIHDIMTVYEARMKSLNALDFDDLLLKTLELLAGHPPVLEVYRKRFRYVMVDEYQDTNHAQYELVRILTAESRNLCVVGDDDQSIYGWRGADIRNILDFEKDFPDAVIIKLEQNYRSTATILDAANQVIAHNTDRKDKKLWTEKDSGSRITVYRASDEHDEAAWIAARILELKKEGMGYGHDAVLYRANSQSRVIEEMMIRSGIPYKVFGGQKFYERKEIRDILAYLRVIVNPSDDISLSRIINVPKRSIGDTTVQLLTDYASASGIPLFSALNDLPDSLGTRARNAVSEFATLMTMLCAMKDVLPLEEFVDYVISQTGLEKQYVQENTEEAVARLENIGEFRGTLHEFAASTEDATLEAYLENVSLMTDLDRETDEDGYVTMMTLHSAKGLEFDNVFIPGMEENVFPSYRSVNEENRLEEERRLMYVGITRARNRLFLCHAESRMLYNQFSHNAPSRFLDEIPERLVRHESFDGFAGAHGPRQNSRPETGSFRKKQEYSGWDNASDFDFTPSSVRTPVSTKPRLTLKGVSLDKIPGVSRGFTPSPARAFDSSISKLFREGDSVMHPKFGTGKVRQITGSGSDARIVIDFGPNGTRELSLAVAPIVKVEEES